jgi:hypothetical protein
MSAAGTGDDIEFQNCSPLEKKRRIHNVRVNVLNHLLVEFICSRDASRRSVAVHVVRNLSSDTSVAKKEFVTTLNVDMWMKYIFEHPHRATFQLFHVMDQSKVCKALFENGSVSEALTGFLIAVDGRGRTEDIEMVSEICDLFEKISRDKNTLMKICRLLSSNNYSIMRLLCGIVTDYFDNQSGFTSFMMRVCKHTPPLILPVYDNLLYYCDLSLQTNNESGALRTEIVRIYRQIVV